MKKLNKLLAGICVGTLGFTSISFGIETFNYESAKKIAENYIINSSFDENWKEKNPQIGEGKFFYTDSDSPSYIEFKVSCEKNPDCGFIMVNYDGDDVSIPIASTSGNTPSEILGSQLENTENTFYYFSPFEQYAENKISGEVTSILPEERVIESDILKEDVTTQEIAQNTERKNKLKEKLNQAKKDSKNFKKSSEFKKMKKELKEKKQTIEKDELSFKMLDFAVADIDEGIPSSYTSPGTANIFITGESTSDCGSRIPCYNQYKKNYNSKPAYSGCSPTAMAMIYGYYDRNGKSNLIPGTAVSNSSDPNNFNTTIKSVIDILRTQMSGSYIDSGSYYSTSVTNGNFKNGIQYAVDKGYTLSTAVTQGGDITTLFNEIKSEINNNRPVVLHLKTNSVPSIGHTVVGYGYRNIGTTPIVRINMGWGSTSNINGYKTANIDYNINSMYYGGNTNHAYAITKINIK